jgi:hypothetical protein
MSAADIVRHQEVAIFLLQLAARVRFQFLRLGREADYETVVLLFR